MPFPEVLDAAGGATVRVRVSAGGSRDRIVGVHGDALKLSVRQPPEKGRANRAVAKLLADALQRRPGDIEVVSGKTSRDKVVFIRGLDAESVRANLVPFCPS